MIHYDYTGKGPVSRTKGLRMLSRDEFEAMVEAESIVDEVVDALRDENLVVATWVETDDGDYVLRETPMRRALNLAFGVNTVAMENYRRALLDAARALDEN